MSDLSKKDAKIAAKEAAKAQKIAAKEAQRAEKSMSRQAQADKYGRKAASAVIQNGVMLTNVSIYDKGYVKISGSYEKLLGISGDTQVNKKTGIGRSAATIASFATPFPGFNLLSPGQRGRISLTIVTDKKTHLFSTDQVHESAVRNYQSLLGAGTAILQMTQIETVSNSPQQISSTDLGTQLKQISELHAQGILSDEEFTAAKSKLLGN